MSLTPAYPHILVSGKLNLLLLIVYIFYHIWIYIFCLDFKIHLVPCIYCDHIIITSNVGSGSFLMIGSVTFLVLMPRDFALS